jgi:flagellar motor switch protein FliN/FliY
MALNSNSFGVNNYYLLWSQTMASIMGQLSGKEAGVEIARPADDSSSDRLWVTFTLGETLLGEHAFAVSRADALHLGQLFMGEIPNPSAEFTPDHSDSLAELFRQFSGTVAVQLKAELGTECTIRFKDTQQPAWTSPVTSSLVMMTEPRITIASYIDAGLLNSLTKINSVSTPEQISAPPVSTEQPVVAEATPPPAVAPAAIRPDLPVPPAVAAQAETVAKAPINDKNLDLLLDVPIEVSIRFGTRQMLLKDVLDLSSGAMVELDRRVQEHIELVLGGRVIARGEAVIVDGNYGIRISEVLSPAQRLAEIA